MEGRGEGTPIGNNVIGKEIRTEDEARKEENKLINPRLDQKE